MNRNSFRRSTAIAGVFAMASLVAACAHHAPPPPPPPAEAAPPPAAAAPPPPPPPAAMQGWVTVARLHLRAHPSVRSRVLATLPRGTEVHPTGQMRGAWRRVRAPMGVGWVDVHFLKPAP